MKDKTILHLGKSIDDGGAAMVLKNYFTILKKNDLSNNHFLMTEKSDHYNSIIDFNFIKNNNFLSQIFSWSNYFTLIKVLKKTKPSIVHIHQYGNLSPSVLYAINRNKKKENFKVIQTVHTFEYVCAHHAGYDYKKKIRCTDCSKDVFKLKIFKRDCSRLGKIHSYGRGLTTLMASYIIKKGIIDYWITPSEFLMNKMLNQPYILRNKITVVKNPIVKLKEREQKSNNKYSIFTVVSFGRLSPEKNIDCVIKSFKSLPPDTNILLKIIGSGSEEVKLKKLVRENNLEDKVSFVPFLSKEELDVVLKKCHVSIMSSKCYENAPLAVVESIQTGLIPIVCNHGGMKEMIDVAKFGITFKSEDYLDLKDKILDVYNNYDSFLPDLLKSNKELDFTFGDKIFFDVISKIYNKIVNGK